MAGGALLLTLTLDLAPIAVLGLAAAAGAIWRVPE
jgi:hypothetical protein